MQTLELIEHDRSLPDAEQWGQDYYQRPLVPDYSVFGTVLSAEIPKQTATYRMEIFKRECIVMFGTKYWGWVKCDRR